MKGLNNNRSGTTGALLSLLLLLLVCAVTVSMDARAGVMRELSGFDTMTACADQAYSDEKCTTYVCVDGPDGVARLKVSVAHGSAGTSTSQFGSVARTVTLTGSAENKLYDIRLETASAVTTLTPKSGKYLMVDFAVSFTMPAHYVYDDDNMEITLRSKADTLVTKDCFTYDVNTSALQQHSDVDRKVTLQCHMNLCNAGTVPVFVNGSSTRVYNTSVTVPIGKMRHVVRFDANAEDAECDMDRVDLVCGDSLGELPGKNVTHREGYRLIGWFDAPDGGQEYTKNSSICQNITLYAHWFENKGNFDLSAVYEDEAMFAGDTLITGGEGTAYDEREIDSGSAHIDREGSPGYFTEGQVN